MNYNYRLFTILFVLIFQSLSIWSTVTALLPVPLYNKSKPVVSNIPKPSKVPVNISIPLNVYLDEDSKQLMFVGSLDEVYEYSIYSEDNEEILHDVIECSGNTVRYLDLSAYPSGIYILRVSIGSHTFEGPFELD